MSHLVSGGARVLAFSLALLVGLHVLPEQAAAHPADELLQEMTVRLEPDRAEVSIAIGGGLLANEMVLRQLGVHGDEEITDDGARAWAEQFLADFEVTLNGAPIELTADDLTLTVPDAFDFLIGIRPLVVTFDATLPEPQGEAPVAHDLIVQNGYLLELTDFRVRTEAGAGTRITLEPQPSRMARIGFEVDPRQVAAGSESGADAAMSWGDGGVVARAKGLLEGPKSPLLMAVFIGVFLAMGALHALQPGHGKALVAAYLVATGGTPRDAVALAGIVTFTHTIVVFVLALATLGASQFLLPSRVIPALTVLSGVLVAGMGVVMLRNAIRKVRRRSAHGHDHHHHHHDHGHDHAHHHHHDHSHHHHHDHHDHSVLTDEEHARLHLEEVQRIRPGGADGRRLSVRNLVAMGVFGGIAPCPDALAILLLAVGINQFALGMLALVAFSVGLAGVLIGFGLVIALVGPVWTRFGRRRGRSISGGLGRVVGVSPVVSAAFVLMLGLAMVWSAGAL